MKNYLMMFICLLIFSACTDSTETRAAGDLDGKTYSVTVSEKDKTSETTPDELIFKDGTFFSADCEQYGFSPASYASSSEDNKTTFTSTLTSEKEGQSDWNGTVEGENISGSFTWSKEGQAPIVYIFSGKLKK